MGSVWPWLKDGSLRNQFGQPNQTKHQEFSVGINDIQLKEKLNKAIL